MSDGAEELRRTALHATHAGLGARLVPFAGYEMPVQYSSIKEEHEAVRERAGLFDVSHMGQIQLRGKRAAAAAEELVTCEVSTLAVGQARYGLLLDETGGCIDDVMLNRVDEDDFFFCVNASNVDSAQSFETTIVPVKVTSIVTVPESVNPVSSSTTYSKRSVPAKPSGASYSRRPSWR